jgi:hypothetical protein
MLRLLLLVVLVLPVCLPGFAQQTGNQRLVLKDGSWQVVTKYQKAGDRVRYFSAERGQWEEIPAALVDWPATEKYAKDHAPGAKPAPEATPQEPPPPQAGAPSNPEAAEIDKEELAERARTPEVAHDLRLPDEDGVWALDTYRDLPELVALVQNTGNVGGAKGHRILKSALNPLGGVQQNVQIPGAESKVRLHISDPVFYVSLTDPDDSEASSSAVTVDTHGGSAMKDKDLSSPSSQYAIIRVTPNYKHDYRVVSGVKVSVAGKVTQSQDVMPTTAQVLPGKHWLKLVPAQPLNIGDYALIEVLGPGVVNLSVWDFRIDPQAHDNKNAIMPLQRDGER